MKNPIDISNEPKSSLPMNDYLYIEKNLYRYVGKIKESPHAVIDFKKIIKDILLDCLKQLTSSFMGILGGLNST